ncbi:MAG: hypothetical protein HY784_02975, partial [Chloroflexi bacterium]|nr:hypothetical protein [Chloroflexota bacterium]
FQELSKLGGPPGWALSAAVASATTVAMGYAAILWFERGEKLSTGSLKKITAVVTAALLEALKSAGRRKPTRKGLEQRIQQALAESAPEEERAVLDAAAAADPAGAAADPGPEGAACAS